MDNFYSATMNFPLDEQILMNTIGFEGLRHIPTIKDIEQKLRMFRSICEPVEFNYHCERICLFICETVRDELRKQQLQNQQLTQHSNLEGASYNLKGRNPHHQQHCWVGCDPHYLCSFGKSAERRFDVSTRPNTPLSSCIAQENVRENHGDGFVPLKSTGVCPPQQHHQHHHQQHFSVGHGSRCLCTTDKPSERKLDDFVRSNTSLLSYSRGDIVPSTSTDKENCDWTRVTRVGFDSPSEAETDSSEASKDVTEDLSLLQPQAAEVKIISNWTVDKRGKQLLILGELVHRNANRIKQNDFSAVVLAYKGSRLVRTNEGLIKLKGEFTSHAGLPKQIAHTFKNGFPTQWRKVLQNWSEEAKKNSGSSKGNAEKKRKRSSSNIKSKVVSRSSLEKSEEGSIQIVQESAKKKGSLGGGNSDEIIEKKAKTLQQETGGNRMDPKHEVKKQGKPLLNEARLPVQISKKAKTILQESDGNRMKDTKRGVKKQGKSLLNEAHLPAQIPETKTKKIMQEPEGKEEIKTKKETCPKQKEKKKYQRVNKLGKKKASEQQPREQNQNVATSSLFGSVAIDVGNLMPTGKDCFKASVADPRLGCVTPPTPMLSFASDAISNTSTKSNVSEEIPEDRFHVMKRMGKVKKAHGPSKKRIGGSSNAMEMRDAKSTKESKKVNDIYQAIVKGSVKTPTIVKQVFRKKNKDIDSSCPSSTEESEESTSEV